MALKVSVPLHEVGELLEEFSMMSPISPDLGDNRDATKILCSPIGSESSGVSSLDSEEIKKSSTSSSPTHQERGSSVSSSESVREGEETPAKYEEDDAPQFCDKTLESPVLMSPKPQSSDAPSPITEPDQLENDNKNETLTVEDEAAVEAARNDKDNYKGIEESKKISKRLVDGIRLNNRNILDLAKNLKNSNSFIHHAHLPDNNLKMFLANRSQYHRLGANGHIQEYVFANCKCCDFIYPDVGYNNNVEMNTRSKVAAHGGGIAAGVYAFHLAANGAAQMSPAAPMWPPQPQQQQPPRFGYQTTINDLLSANLQHTQQQQQLATVTALLSNGKEPSVNPYGGNSTASTAFNRIFGNIGSAVPSMETLAAALLIHNNGQQMAKNFSNPQHSFNMPPTANFNNFYK